jgi:hypothetical protein
MKICLSGPRGVVRLPARAIEQVELLISLQCEVEIGDEATGGDHRFQEELATRGYRLVRVWHCGGAPRVNVGGWPTVRVPGSFTERDRRTGGWDGLKVSAEVMETVRGFIAAYL